MVSPACNASEEHLGTLRGVGETFVAESTAAHVQISDLILTIVRSFAGTILLTFP